MSKRESNSACLVPSSFEALGDAQRMLHIIEAGAKAEILAEAEHELDNASVGLDVRLEDVILGHLALPVPGAPPLGRLAELERVYPLLHLLQPLTQAAHLTEISNLGARPTHVKYSSTVLINQS
jgi:hypothetical protein